MGPTLDRRFAKVWQALKKNAGIKSSPWFKKADAGLSKKVDAYQKAFSEAQSGTIEDLLKLGKALQNLDAAVVKHIDAKGLSQISDDEARKAGMRTLLIEINRFRAEVQHERATFDSRLRAAASAADNDLKRLESLEPVRKKELWKGFGIEL